MLCGAQAVSQEPRRKLPKPGGSALARDEYEIERVALAVARLVVE
jgi:hypothetical protein